MPNKQLPTKLLVDIFRYVDSYSQNRKRDLLNCAFVCLAWYTPACRVLHEKICIANTKNILTCFARQNKKFGHYCKELQLAQKPDWQRNEEDELGALLSYLPNIEILLLDYGWCRSDRLRQLAIHSNLIKHVHTIIPSGLPWNQKEAQPFFDCANAFKDTLQNMELYLIGMKLSAGKRKSGNIISFLPNFAALTELSITNKADKDFKPLPNLSMFSVMRSCPNLISFEIDNEFQEPEDKNNFDFDHSKVEYLDINIPEFNRQHIDYICSNFTGLKELKLRSGFRSRNLSFSENVGTDQLNRLQELFTNIDVVNFDRGEEIRSEIDDYWPFVTRFVNAEVSLPTHISITVACSSLLTEKFLLRKRLDSIFCHYGMNSDYREYVSTDSYPLMVENPAMMEKLIPSGLREDEIQSLHMDFDLDDMLYKQRGVKFESRLTILESVLNRFLNLNFFYLKSRLPDKSGVSDIKISSNQEDDTLDTRAEEEFVTPSCSVTPSSKFAYVLLRNLHITRDCEPILKLLPNTKYLKMLDCKLYKDKNHNFTINLGDLCLQRLVLNMATILKYESEGEKSIAFQIEESNPKQKSYYILNIESTGETARRWRGKRPRTKYNHLMNFETVDAAFLEMHRHSSSSRPKIFIIKCRNLKNIVIYTKDGDVAATTSDCHER